MLSVLNDYALVIFRALILFAWLGVYLKNAFEANNRYAIKMFILFLAIVSISNVSMLLTARSPIVYIIFWAVVMIFELFYISSLLFKLAKARKKYSEIFVITLAVLAIPIVLAAILSYTNHSWDPVNTTDFYNQILLFIGSILVIRSLLGQPSFIDHIESFFIFAGFILYFGGTLLSTNTMLINYLGNWGLGRFAIFISLIFWLGSSFFVWKIRSRYSS
jgi:hypothetical protein